MKKSGSHIATGAQNQVVLSVLIPVYQRFEGALQACQSVLTHNQDDLEAGKIHVLVCDDASPSIDPEALGKEIATIHPLIEFKRNTNNLGMSANILEMVAACRSLYCTILTDDDWFEPGALTEILALLESPLIRREAVTSILSPRYSYLESGELVTISCRIRESNQLFPSNPRGNALALAECAYILSGYFFRPDCVDLGLWRQHIENAFFPIIYCASIIRTGSTFYLDQSLVHHTSQNLCHWEAWGASDRAQQIRLCHDYLESLAIVSEYTRSQYRGLRDQIRGYQERSKAYIKRLIEKQSVVVANPIPCIPRRLWLDPAFIQALAGFLYFMLRTNPSILLPSSRKKTSEIHQ
jgi:glycosyltransferase involved in cell wall biosynthesis